MEATAPISEQIPFCTKVSRYFSLFIELGVKDCGCFFKSIINYIWYKVDNHCYDLNPERITPLKEDSTTAKVVLFAHGVGGGEFCALPLAKKCRELGVKNIFSVQLKQTDENPVPVETIAAKVDLIAKKCLEQKISKIQLIGVGHSLGGMALMKFFPTIKTKHIEPTKLFLLASRIKYVENQFSWFSDDIKEEVNNLYSMYTSNFLDSTEIITIRGRSDALVPEESVHFTDHPENHHTIDGYGHGSIVYAPEAIDLIANQIETVA